MTKEQLTEMINEALAEATINRPYVEVGDIIDTDFATALATRIKAAYADVEEKAWQYEELRD